MFHWCVGNLIVYQRCLTNLPTVIITGMYQRIIDNNENYHVITNDKRNIDFSMARSIFLEVLV